MILCRTAWLCRATWHEIVSCLWPDCVVRHDTKLCRVCGLIVSCDMTQSYGLNFLCRTAWLCKQILKRAPCRWTWFPCTGTRRWRSRPAARTGTGPTWSRRCRRTGANVVTFIGLFMYTNSGFHVSPCHSMWRDCHWQVSLLLIWTCHEESVTSYS
jgi:hypothetical protein